MQCSLLWPFWVASFIKGQVKEACFNLYGETRILLAYAKVWNWIIFTASDQCRLTASGVIFGTKGSTLSHEVKEENCLVVWFGSITDRKDGISYLKGKEIFVAIYWLATCEKAHLLLCVGKRCNFFAGERKKRAVITRGLFPSFLGSH